MVGNTSLRESCFGVMAGLASSTAPLNGDYISPQGQGGPRCRRHLHLCLSVSVSRVSQVSKAYEAIRPRSEEASGPASDACSHVSHVTVRNFLENRRSESALRPLPPWRRCGETSPAQTQGHARGPCSVSEDNKPGFRDGTRGHRCDTPWLRFKRRPPFSPLASLYTSLQRYHPPDDYRPHYPVRASGDCFPSGGSQTEKGEPRQSPTAVGAGAAARSR